jgi:hypothetical protein
MTVSWKEAEMRTLFVVYLGVICAGLLYFIVVAAWHT